MIESIIAQGGITLRIVGYDDAVGRVYLRREFRRPFPRVLDLVSPVLEPLASLKWEITRVSSMLVFLTRLCT